jgi:hypothetical protein
MPPKKASAPGAAALQPLDPNQETLSLSKKLEARREKPPVQHFRRRSCTKRSGTWKSSINKLLKKCVILLKMNRIKGPNTGSFVKKAYSTKMDGMMILIMIPSLLMMLLPWQHNCRLPHGPRHTSHLNFPCMMGTQIQSSF